MNYKVLFEEQSKLDAEIEKHHPIKTGENRYEKRVAAIITELAEYANEMKESFKFWSVKSNNLNEALEELVDVFHFILSVGNFLDVAKDTYEVKSSEKSIARQYIELINAVSVLILPVFDKKAAHKAVMEGFLTLVVSSGFKVEQIESGYYEKNKINYQRQLNGH